MHQSLLNDGDEDEIINNNEMNMVLDMISEASSDEINFEEYVKIKQTKDKKQNIDSIIYVYVKKILKILCTIIFTIIIIGIILMLVLFII